MRDPEEVENLDSIVNFTICCGIAQSDDQGKSGTQLADLEYVFDGIKTRKRKLQPFEYAYVKELKYGPGS